MCAAGDVYIRWSPRGDVSDGDGIVAARVEALRQEEIWDLDAARSYDTPGTGTFAPEVLEPAVDRLAALAGGGRALEFAIGTGRVAVPLSERRIPVSGIELSTAMVDQLRTRADEDTIPVLVGDMASAHVPGVFALVYNTISNLLTQGQQVACFCNAARHLAADGRFVVELPHRYIWPAELDLIAQLAGLELESRHADWAGAEFTAESRSHVSVYRRSTAP